MQHTTKYPVTVRELVEMARERGMEVSRMLEVLGPIPMPPEGYTLAPKSDTRWIGQEIVNGRYIITPAWTWNSAGGFHSIEVWMADHEAPNYASMSPADALQLAADLTAAAHAILAAGGN